MSLKVSETTKDYLIKAPLPTHGKSYTVVSHQQVIDNTLKLLTDSGFEVEREMYRASLNANVAQGIYHIKPLNTSDTDILNEEEVGMMFAWTNSYDKSVRFQSAIGGYVAVCHNGMLCGEINYARKHTGSADNEIRMHISNQVKNAEKHFKEVINVKNSLRGITLNKQEQAEFLGRMLITEKIISPTQLSSIVKEMNKPSYDYQCDQENAWAFYNHVTHGLKDSHPRTWMSDTEKFHKFITADLLAQMGIQKKDLDWSQAGTLQDPTLIDIEDGDGENFERVNVDSKFEVHTAFYLG